MTLPLLIALAVFATAPDDALRARCEASSQTRDDGRDDAAFARCIELKGLPEPVVVEAVNYGNVEAASTQPRSLSQSEVDRIETDRRYREQMERLQADADAAEEKLQKRCGKNYQRIRVGMSWDIVRRCSGVEFEVVYADATAKVYDSDGGLVRVEHGVVTRILFK